MSSKHKDRGRPQPKKGYDSRHQHRENRHSTLYTPKQLRDSTTKATEDMNKIYQSFWAKKPLYGHVTNVNNELEVKFSTPIKGNPSKVQPLRRNDYDNVVTKLRSLGFTTVTDVGSYMLRIQPEMLDTDTGKYTLMNVRTEIRGLAAIQEYCIHNDLQKLLSSTTYSSSVSMQNKKDAVEPETNKRIYPADFHDFHFRVAYKTEEDYNLVNPYGIAKAIIDDWLKNKKEFRYINRVTFTHPDYPVRIDMSIVKSPKNNSNMSMRAYTTTEAGVFQADEAYEIEIEVDNHEIGQGTRTETMEELIDKVRKCTKFVLMGLQETAFPVSVSDRIEVGMEYLRLTGFNPHMELSSNPHFVGPSSFTLQIGNISDNKSPDYNSTLTNIRDNYTVTDKADGERRLFFISNNGLVYLINTNMKMLFSGARTNNKLFYNSLLDGEIISHDKHGNFINLFAAFDVYIVNGKDVRSHVFYRNNMLDGGDDDDKHRNKSRLQTLSNIMKDLNLVSVVNNQQTQTPMQSPIRVSVKQFYADNGSTTIFTGCRKILDRIDNDLFEYTTDGLIFTPSNLGVGAEEVGKVGPLKKTTWTKSFKWKPASFNTVDFLVSVNKGKDSKPMVKTIYDGGLGIGSAEQVKQYHTLTLMCGFNDVQRRGNKEETVYMNPCQDVYDDTPSSPNTEGERTSSTTLDMPTSGYRPMQFFPSDPYDADGGVCNVILRSDGNGDPQMFTEENEAFGDNTIVEFRYELTNETKWRWIPLRVRYDKTAELRRSLSNFGNPYHVANSNWRSIHYPITSDMIKTGLDIPHDNVGDDGVYYNRMNGTKTTGALCNFHNLYVKKMLITKTSRPGDTLIDLACGKGGDFSKWIQARLSFVFGVDLSKDNIENNINGACARYLNTRKTTKTMPSALFVIGNSSRNIRSGKAMETEKAKQITESVFGSIPKNASLGKGVTNHYGIGEDGFNVTSCQFALHYFFEDTGVLHQFIRNVVECTKVGGYFIGTCYDGKRIFNMLKGKDKHQEVELYHNKSKLWGVTKLYSKDTFDDDHSSVGYEIKVFQETINQKISEYLVNFDYLIRIMENYGFQVLPDIDAQNMGLPSGCGLFEDLFRQMTQSPEGRRRQTSEFGAAHDMSDKEKEISFKNRYFVFKKIINVDITKIVPEEIDQQDDTTLIEPENQDANENVIESEEELEQKDESEPSMIEEDEQPTPAPKKKRTITVRKPRKLNQSMLLQGSSNDTTA
jgi:hypothetical protein